MFKTARKMDGKSGVPNKKARMAMGMQGKQFVAGKNSKQRLDLIIKIILII